MNGFLAKSGSFQSRRLILAVALIFITGCTRSGTTRRTSTIPPEPRSYSLPANDVPDVIRQRLDPWIAGFVGLSPQEAQTRLNERWAGITRPSLVALRDTLAQFEIRAIVDYGKGGRIYAVRPNSDETFCGNSWYLPGPMQRQEIRDRLTSHGLEENDALTEFLYYFGGLAEDTTTAGDFVYSETPWPTFTDSWDGTIVGFEEWKDSLMLYHARNGCELLVHPNGKVGWWVMQERLAGEQAADFDEFLVQFNEHRKLAWPFDPYGVPEDER